MSQQQPPEHDKPLRARDAQTVIATGVDVGVTKHEHDARDTAPHIHDQERIKPIIWFALLVLVVIVTGILLGVFIL